MKKYTNEEEIRLTAYYMWEESGRPWGQENEFWQKACDKLMNSKSSCKTSKCTTKKASASTKTSTKTASKTSKASTITKTTKAKTNLKAVSAHTTIKSNAAINNAYGFKSNVSALKSKLPFKFILSNDTVPVCNKFNVPLFSIRPNINNSALIE